MSNSAPAASSKDVLSVKQLQQDPLTLIVMAVVRKLALRLYQMLKTNAAYPEVVRVESSPRVASSAMAIYG